MRTRRLRSLLLVLPLLAAVACTGGRDHTTPGASGEAASPAALEPGHARVSLHVEGMT